MNKTKKSQLDKAKFKEFVKKFFKGMKWNLMKHHRNIFKTRVNVLYLNNITNLV